MGTPIEFPVGFKVLNPSPLEAKMVVPNLASLQNDSSLFVGYSPIWDEETEMLYFCSGGSVGAWEFTDQTGAASSPKVIFVNHAATGANDGTTWADAFTSIHDAINVAKFGNQIWVAKGTYKPSLSGDRTASYLMKEGVKFYGGFSGHEYVVNTRDLSQNETILSGDLNSDGVKTNFSYNIFGTTTATFRTLIDGFTLRDTHYDGTSGATEAGAIKPTFCQELELNNIKFINNTSTSYTPIMACVGSGGQLIANNIVIDGAEATWYAFMIRGLSVYLNNVTVRNCNVTGITVGIKNCAGIINNFLGEDNVASQYGSSIYLMGDDLVDTVSRILITNSTFLRNTDHFGTVHVGNDEGGTFYVVNCLFEGNTSNNGVLDSSHATELNVINNTFVNNNQTIPTSSDITIQANRTGDSYIYNNICQGTARSITVEAGITGKIYVSKNICSGQAISTSPTEVWDIIAGTAELDANNRPVKGSLAVVAGDTSYYEKAKEIFTLFGVDITEDYTGKARIIGSSIDIGAMEYQYSDTDELYAVKDVELEKISSILPSESTTMQEDERVLYVHEGGSISGDTFNGVDSKVNFGSFDLSGLSGETAPLLLKFSFAKSMPVEPYPDNETTAFINTILEDSDSPILFEIQRVGETEWNFNLLVTIFGFSRVDIAPFLDGELHDVEISAHLTDSNLSTVTIDGQVQTQDGSFAGIGAPNWDVVLQPEMFINLGYIGDTYPDVQYWSGTLKDVSFDIGNFPVLNVVDPSTGVNTVGVDGVAYNVEALPALGITIDGVGLIPSESSLIKKIASVGEAADYEIKPITKPFTQLKSSWTETDEKSAAFIENVPNNVKVANQSFSLLKNQSENWEEFITNELSSLPLNLGGWDLVIVMEAGQHTQPNNLVFPRFYNGNIIIKPLTAGSGSSKTVSFYQSGGTFSFANNANVVISDIEISAGSTTLTGFSGFCNNLKFYDCVFNYAGRTSDLMVSEVFASVTNFNACYYTGSSSATVIMFTGRNDYSEHPVVKPIVQFNGGVDLSAADDKISYLVNGSTNYIVDNCELFYYNEVLGKKGFKFLPDTPETRGMPTYKNGDTFDLDMDWNPRARVIDTSFKGTVPFGVFNGLTSSYGLTGISIDDRAGSLESDLLIEFDFNINSEDWTFIESKPKGVYLVSAQNPAEDNYIDIYVDISAGDLNFYAEAADEVGGIYPATDISIPKAEIVGITHRLKFFLRVDGTVEISLVGTPYSSSYNEGAYGITSEAWDFKFFDTIFPDTLLFKGKVKEMLMQNLRGTFVDISDPSQGINNGTLPPASETFTDISQGFLDGGVTINGVFVTLNKPSLIERNSDAGTIDDFIVMPYGFGVLDASKDGVLYGRKNGAWSHVTSRKTHEWSNNDVAQTYSIDFGGDNEVVGVEPQGLGGIAAYEFSIVNDDNAHRAEFSFDFASAGNTFHLDSNIKYQDADTRFDKVTRILTFGAGIHKGVLIKSGSNYLLEFSQPFV